MSSEHNRISPPPNHEQSRGAVPAFAGLEQHETLVKVLLTLEHPAPEQLTTLDRSARYQTSMARATAQRQAIQEWLESRGLVSEIVRMGAANTFNILFICCTPRAAQQLQHAPGVVDVAVVRSMDGTGNELQRRSCHDGL